MKVLETKRLILRPWQSADADDMFTYASSPNVGPRAGWKPHESVAESAAYIAETMRADDTWALELKETGRVIGSIGLHARKNPHLSAEYDREIGFVLGEAYWGQGLMPEAVRAVVAYAFDSLGLSALMLAHFDFNSQSRRVIEKSGFHWFQHTDGAYARYDGALLNEDFYLLRRGEWLAEQGKQS